MPVNNVLTTQDLASIDARLTTMEGKLDTVEDRVADLEEGGGPPPNSAKTALYLPLYTPEISAVAITANGQLVGYTNLFTANPASGPQARASRPDVEKRIYQLRKDNPVCIILGYVPTGYADTQRPGDPYYRVGGKGVPVVTGWVRLWLEWLEVRALDNNNQVIPGEPILRGIDGIMQDEYLTSSSALPYYRLTAAMIRSEFAARGRTGPNAAIIRGNPGSPVTDERHVSENLCDFFSINENGSPIPNETELKRRTFYDTVNDRPRYPRSKFNWLSHSLASSAWTDTQYRMLQKYCKTILITHRTFSSNPWAGPPDSLDRQIALIKAQV